jgi:hypothetical protein
MPPLHNLWQRGLNDLTLDQINHHERAGVVPLAFSFLHLVTTEDRFISERMFGEPNCWESGDWAERIGGNLPVVRRGSALDVAETVSFADLGPWKEYQTLVFERTEAAFADVADDRFDEVIFPRIPDTMRGGFVDAVSAGGPVILGDLMELVIYQHAIRHLGEIEHARALVGLRGLD